MDFFSKNVEWMTGSSAFCDSHVCIEQLDGFKKDWVINVKDFLNVIDLEERRKVLS